MQDGHTKRKLTICKIFVQYRRCSQRKGISEFRMLVESKTCLRRARALPPKKVMMAIGATGRPIVLLIGVERLYDL
jgi:hypothetical protein